MRKSEETIMLKPETIHISGPAYILETIHIPSEQVLTRGVAVINHPNPPGRNKHQQSYPNCRQSLKQTRLPLLPAQLCGVGGSGGTHDYGRGETRDCLAVIDYACASTPRSP